jgi:hypothetical protein
MVAALTITPASGSITATETVCRVDVSGADSSDDTAYDADAYPTQPEIPYYITTELDSVEQGRSHIFAVNGGAHQWNNYIFPEAGSWNVKLYDSRDDSEVATAAVTVA